MGKVEFLAELANPLEVGYSQMPSRSARACNLSAAPGYGMSHKEVTLEIEHFHNDEDVDFHISSPREMRPILQGIAAQNACVCMYYGNDQHFIMSTLLGVSEHGMWLDIGPFPPENQRLLLSDKITFVSAHQQVKIQFVAHHIRNGLFDGKQAFFVELPDHLLRIQRREFFRSAIPPSDLVKCLIPIQPENPDDQVILRAAPLVDISGGGIRLLCDEHEATLLPNTTFPDCQISLPDVGTLTVTIEVRNSIDYTNPDSVVYKRVGCRFIHLDKQMNILLQRQITRLQSESMARRRLSELS